MVAHQQTFLHNGQTIVFTPQVVQTGGRQPEPVSGFSGGEEGGCCGRAISGHDEAMLASKCEIYQVNSGKLGEEVALDSGTVLPLADRYPFPGRFAQASNLLEQHTDKPITSALPARDDSETIFSYKTLNQDIVETMVRTAPITISTSSKRRAGPAGRLSASL